MKCGAGNSQLQLPPNVRLQGFKGGKGGNATFSPFKSLEAHVGGQLKLEIPCAAFLKLI